MAQCHDSHAYKTTCGSRNSFVLFEPQQWNYILAWTTLLQLAWEKPYKTSSLSFVHGPLTRYAKLRVASGMPGTFSQPLQVSDPDMQHGRCVTHVPWCMPGSLTSGFLWSSWRGKRAQHSWRMRNQQFYVSGKRPITSPLHIAKKICQIIQRKPALQKVEYDSMKLL